MSFPEILFLSFFVIGLVGLFFTTGDSDQEKWKRWLEVFGTLLIYFKEKHSHTKTKKNTELKDNGSSEKSLG